MTSNTMASPTQMSQEFGKLTLNVGVDDGYAETNVVVLDESGGVKLQMSIPSRARAGSFATSVGDFSKNKGVSPCYETEGTQFTVGDFKDSETARFDNYPFSGMNRAIIMHALRTAGLSENLLNIGTGLPISTYFKNGVVNKSAIDMKKESLKKAISALDNSAMPRIKSHQVFPEGLAAFIDYAIDDAGELRINPNEETIGIVDIGGRTTDIAVVVPYLTIDHARSGSQDIGVLNLLEALKSAVSEKLNADVPLHLIDKALRTRKLIAWGNSHDVGELIDECTKNVFERIVREMDRRFGSAVDITKILLVGGGARVFSNVSAQYPNIVIPDDPEYANARGFAKYLSL